MAALKKKPHHRIMPHKQVEIGECYAIANPENPVLSGNTRAERVIEWIETLIVPSGVYAGRKIKLMPWQKRIIRRIYRTTSRGKRVVRTALLSMGRKNGKTSLASALALAHLSGPEAIQGGQVLSAAADRPQAAIVFGQMMEMALANEHLAKRITFRTFNKTAEDIINGSTYAALSSDAKKAHGLSPSLWIGDEVAQWRGRDLLDALRTGMGAHEEPLGLIISTRSPNIDNPLEEFITYSAKIKAGEVKDSTFEAWVYSADLKADPWSMEAWKASNPALGKFRSLKDIEVQAAQAQAIPSLENSFRAYVLNQPISADDRWISAQDWDACSGDAEATGPCFAGLDLAGGANDLTAFALFWPKTGKLKVWGFIPEAYIAQKEKEDAAPYQIWAGQGYIVVTPGKTIDRAWLANWIEEQTDAFDLVKISCDRWLLDDLRAQIERAGVSLNLDAHGTGFKDMSPAVAAAEQAILNRKVAHNSNPALRWCVSNISIEQDASGNRKTSKAKSKGRIDIAQAMILAISGASRNEDEKVISFGDRELIIAI